MIRFMSAALLIAATAGCSGDGNPFFDADGNRLNVTATTGTGVDPDTAVNNGNNNGIDTGVDVPPGTEEPSANAGIARFEPYDGSGGGLVTQVSYNRATDTFTVDNLGFDGANTYQRDDLFGTLGGYAVFVADDNTPDFLTNTPISQIAPYVAIYSQSAVQIDGEPRASFAIVRTGGYAGYGFGGFVYQRSGPVNLPDSGQAQWSGRYAGVRVFDPIGGIEYTRGDAIVAIDFEDFNANDAVRGRLFNREAFDSAGNQITLGGDGNLVLPTLPFVIQEGGTTLTAEGEITGQLRNTIVTADGTVEVYEEGEYYGIIAGNTRAGDGGELVGVFVVTSDDPRYENVTAQETGGFILSR